MQRDPIHASRELVRRLCRRLHDASSSVAARRRRRLERHFEIEVAIFGEVELTLLGAEEGVELVGLRVERSREDERDGQAGRGEVGHDRGVKADTEWPSLVRSEPLETVSLLWVVLVRGRIEQHLTLGAPHQPPNPAFERGDFHKDGDGPAGRNGRQFRICRVRECERNDSDSKITPERGRRVSEKRGIAKLPASQELTLRQNRRFSGGSAESFAAAHGIWAHVLLLPSNRCRTNPPLILSLSR